jgi:RNA polymerase sigma-70 factor (sigma-E family)
VGRIPRLPTDSPHAIIEQSQTGDDEFAAFVAARSQALLRTACLLTGDWATAEDLLQTALAKTYLRWRRLELPGVPETYVRRVLVTTSTSWWRQRWHRKKPVDVTSDDATRPVEPLWRALAALRRKQRAAIVLRYYEDLPDAEVARLLGCSEQTVRSQCSRALAKLRVTPELRDYAPPTEADAEPREDTP